MSKNPTDSTPKKSPDSVSKNLMDITLLVKEFGARPRDGWQRHLDESRDKFYELQASSVIRDNIPTAISVLEDLGYTVSSP